jgi:dienelactone hydrolase
MVPTASWSADESRDDALVEYRFQVDRRSHSVPCYGWFPSSGRRDVPLVLLGHGGSGHKRADSVVGHGEWFAREAGCAAIAVDGPYHGDRVPGPMDAAEYQARNVEDGVEHVADMMVGDWVAAVEEVKASGLADTSRLGYLGMSMGARFGIPTAAALGAALRCFVLGKFGLSRVDPYPAALIPRERLGSEASSVVAPTLLHVQWDDEIFPRDGQFDLFTILGSPDKQLLAHPGPHGETRPTALRSWREFVAGHLV